MVHLFPHWNWLEGAPVDMWAFSNAAEVELFVNNVSMGRSSPGDFGHAQWPKVKYVPGQVKAVAYDSSNKTIATQAIDTTGEPAALRISIKDGVGANGLTAGCNDVALVKVEVVDAEGRVSPIASNNVTFSVSGPAVFLGGGNGDPAEHTADKSETRPAFGGLLLGVFGSTAQEGTVTVTATASGLTAAKMDIKAKQPQFNSSWWCARNQNL
jgi:beta-galactosidase